MKNAIGKSLLTLTVATMVSVAIYGMYVVAEASRQVSILAPQPKVESRPMPKKGKKEMPPKPASSDPRFQ